MKKFKHIIPFLLALIMMLVIPLAACDSCGKKKNDDEEEGGRTLQSISVNTDNAQTKFITGDPFTSQGIVVTASFSNADSDELEVVTLAAGDYTVDSTAFNKDVVGSYSIKVSYTSNNTTKNTSYDVEVVRAKDGLEVTLDGSVSKTYKVSSAQATVEIDVTKIVVKAINRDGSVGGAVTDYSVKLLKGTEEINLTDGKATVGVGVYHIVVSKASETYPGTTRQSFVLVYVEV